MAGSWVKENMWLPDNMTDIGGGIGDPYPAAIIAPHKMWPMVWEEVREEEPEHPVLLFTPISALYGLRLQSITLRHWYPRSARDYDWWEHAQCRILPYTKEK